LFNVYFKKERCFRKLLKTDFCTHVLIQTGSRSLVKIPDPDPGKRCGSDRIRILNTAKEVNEKE
jgi:hypothetical protein